MNTLKQKVLDLVGRDELDEALDQLKFFFSQKNNFLNEATLQQGKLSELQRNIRMGIISYDIALLTKSQIRYSILESLKAFDKSFQPSILVARTGTYELPNSVCWVARELGKQIGENKYKLIVGGWEGVDYIVSESYSKQILHSKLPLYEYLIQVKETQPVFKGGTVLFVKKGRQEWLEAIKYADIVILVGGMGGAYNTYEFAKKANLPVLPIKGTGGDAEKVYDELVKNWSTERYLRDFSETFQHLSKVVINQEDAENVVNNAITLIKELTK